jgi:hypothetical protein
MGNGGSAMSGAGGGGGSVVGAGGTTGNGGQGNPSGGTAQGGTTSGGGGKDAGANTVQVVPTGICQDCMTRDCPTQLSACTTDAACVLGAPSWLSCTRADAGSCVTAPLSTEPALNDFESCAGESCDLCRHLDDGEPSIEILSPSANSTVPLDPTGLIEVSVRVHNFTVTGVGSCGTNASCGHVHLNLDGSNCLSPVPFYNTVIFSVDGTGYADSVVDTSYCKASVVGRTVKVSASLSNNTNHMDRVPPVKAEVPINVTKP